MTNIQRKHVKASLLFSLCCLSPILVQGISFQDILDHSELSSLLLERDQIPFDNPFNAKEESVSIPWKAISLSFPVLNDKSTPIHQELHLSNVPIYLSYLQHILLQEKNYEHAASFSILPELFYRNFPSHSSKISVETALKAPLPLLRPIEEDSLIENLLEACIIYPSDLKEPESQTKLSSSDFHYTPQIQQAVSLAIEKQALPSGKLHFLHQTFDIKSTKPIVTEASFAKEKTHPSSEQYAQEITFSSPAHLLLKDTSVSLQEFSSKEAPSLLEKLIPAPEISSSDMIPLSHHYPHTPSLNLLFTSNVQKERYLSESFRNGIKESADIQIKSFATPLKPHDALTLPEAPFVLKDSNTALKHISHPPVLGETKLPKQSHLKLPSVAPSQPLCSTEDVIQFEHYLSPSLEPYVEWRTPYSIFVPHIGNTYIGCRVAFTSRSYKISSIYTDLDELLAEKAFLRSDPYATDALVAYIMKQTKLPSFPISLIDQSIFPYFTPKSHDTIPSIPISLTPASFTHLMDTSSLSKASLHIPLHQGFYPLYERPELVAKYPSNELIESRMQFPYLMAELETVYPSIPLLKMEPRFIGLVVPETEESNFSKIVDYPFLQEFYTQLSSDINPFLFSYDWINLPFNVASLLNPDKAIHDSTTSYGALSLLEKIGNEQIIDKTFYPNLPFAVLNPRDEAYTSHPWTLTETPDPAFLSLFYSTYSPIAFRVPLFLDSLEYSHAVVFNTDKPSFPLIESLLSSKLESLDQEYECSVSGDFPDAHQPLIPRSEVSSFLAYSKSCEATLNHYSLTTDKHPTHSTSKTPKLLADARLSPDLVSSKIDLISSRKNAALLNQSSRSTHENLAQLPTLQDLRTFSLSEEFSVDVQISPNSKGPGYLFAITLEPTLKQLSSGSPQNFIFLVDRSSSIDKNRLQIFKQAINKSLLYLKEEDTFNVLTFDTEISKMSHESVSVDSSTKHGARRFLETQKRGYKYVLPNLYAILMQTYAMAQESPLPTTVVLLTNGKSLENFNTQDERLARLISTNQNGFTLFTACSSQNNNTLMLEILSNLNRGEFMHSQTNAAFPRKLAAFVKHAGSLIAKDIHVSAAKTDPNLSIEFFPDTTLAPNLYGDRPYTIVGKIDQLCDFDLVLQGRFCENWLNVTKKISFKTARHGGHSIYKDYTMHVAYNKYREFLKEGNTAYLDEAKKVLQPINTSFSY